MNTTYRYIKSPVGLNCGDSDRDPPPRLLVKAYTVLRMSPYCTYVVSGTLSWPSGVYIPIHVPYCTVNVPYCKQAIAMQKCRYFAIFKLLPISNGYTNGYIWSLHHHTCPQLQYGVIWWVYCPVLCRYGAGPAPSRCANNGAFSNTTPTELRIKLPAI